MIGGPTGVKEPTMKRARALSGNPANDRAAALFIAIVAGSAATAVAADPRRRDLVIVPCETPVIGPQVGLLDSHPLVRARTGLCFSRADSKTASGHVGLCLFKPVRSVTAASLRMTSGGVSIRAEGMASTAGWSFGTLVERSRSADGAAVTFEFLACPPSGYAAQVLSPMVAEAELRVAKAHRVVIVAGDTRRELVLGEGR